jgi:hypothetical protein
LPETLADTSDDEELDNYYSNGALRPAVPRRRTAAELNEEMSPLSDDEDLNNGYDNFYGPMDYRSWYINEHDYSPESPEPTPDDRAAARRRNGYSPVSDVDEGEPDQVADPPYSPSEPNESDDDELARYPTAVQILRDGVRNGYAMGFLPHDSDDDEEEEEIVQVSTPRTIRAARRSAFRGAFHLTLLFLLTVIVPGEATDSFVTPSIPTATFTNFHNATLLPCSIATHGSTLHLLNFSWILVTWLDVLHGLCFGVLVTFMLFASLALCIHWRTNSIKSEQVSTRTHKRIFDWDRGYRVQRVSRPASVRHRPYIQTRRHRRYVHSSTTSPYLSHPP